MFLLKTREKLGSYTKCQKVKFWRRLDNVMTKNLFAQTISNRHMEQSKVIQYHSIGVENFGIYFSGPFDSY